MYRRRQWRRAGLHALEQLACGRAGVGKAQGREVAEDVAAMAAADAVTQRPGAPARADPKSKPRYQRVPVFACAQFGHGQGRQQFFHRRLRFWAQFGHTEHLIP